MGQEEVFVHRAFVTHADPRGWLHTPHADLAPAEWTQAVAAARRCQADPHPGLLKVLEASEVQIVTAATALRPMSELILRAGALEADQLLAWVPAIAEAIGHLGAHAAIDPSVVLAGPEAPPVVIGFVPPPVPAAGQVRALGGLFYEGLKGMPPPERVGPGDWVGVKPRLAEAITAALTGAVATPAEWAAKLRAVGSVDTAAGAVAPPGASPPPPPRTSGELIGSYELEQRIATGGIGEVYLARHVRLGRKVALKLLRPELARETDLVRRFFEEARLVNEINHPHIVQVIDFVEEPGRVYCVMELLQGRTLAQLVAEVGPLTVARSVAIARQVCGALQAAHQRGVVHRDIKPDNLFVIRGADGSDFVKVLDFGIAKQLRARAKQTTLGQVMGTPFYMAPEQAQGRAVNARADLYALGVVLWELLTGQSYETVKGRPPLLTVSATGEPIDDRLALVVSLCLEPEEKARPASAEEVGKVLAAVGTAAPAIARRRSPLAAIGVAAMVVGLGVAGVSALPKDPPPAPAPVLPPAPVAPPAVVEAAVRPVVAPAPPRKPALDLAKRMARLKAEHQRLVAAHGADRLTSLEEAAFQQAVADYRPGATAGFRETLEAAEAALSSARARLER